MYEKQKKSNGVKKDGGKEEGCEDCRKKMAVSQVAALSSMQPAM